MGSGLFWSVWQPPGIKRALYLQRSVFHQEPSASAGSYTYKGRPQWALITPEASTLYSLKTWRLLPEVQVECRSAVPLVTHLLLSWLQVLGLWTSLAPINALVTMAPVWGSSYDRALHSCFGQAVNWPCLPVVHQLSLPFGLNNQSRYFPPNPFPCWEHTVGLLPLILCV